VWETLLNKGRKRKSKTQIFNNMQGYCVKCKAKREIKDAKEVTMKGKGKVKRKALTGVCPNCGTKMFRILGKA
jgi:Zn finger protein HypA/HybF involved in hydrogenase expression